MAALALFVNKVRCCTIRPLLGIYGAFFVGMQKKDNVVTLPYSRAE